MSTFTSTVADRPYRLSGLCPRCRTWFDCTDWADLHAPACPRCATRAQQVVRVRVRDRRRTGPRATETWIG